MIPFLVALGFIIHAWTQVEEPVYQGKRLSTWLDDSHWTNGGQTVLSSAATQAVQALGTNALPYLVHMMQARDSKLEIYTAIYVYRFLHIQTPLRSADCQRAAFGFYALGPTAKPAYPELVKLVLAADGKGWVAGVFRDDADTIALLADGLHSPDVKVRRRAAMAFGYFQKTPTVCIPALTQALNDRDTQVQMWAAAWLGHYGPAAKSATPALAQLTNSADSMVRIMATQALRDINDTFTNPPATQE